MISKSCTIFAESGSNEGPVTPAPPAIVVSQDMQFFAHTHPVKQPDGTFTLDTKFPHPGMYRLLSDFYPAGRNAATGTAALEINRLRVVLIMHVPDSNCTRRMLSIASTAMEVFSQLVR